MGEIGNIRDCFKLEGIWFGCSDENCETCWLVTGEDAEDIRKKVNPVRCSCGEKMNSYNVDVIVIPRKVIYEEEP